MTNRSVTRRLASHATSTRHAVLTQGPAVAVVGALHVTSPVGPEHAPLGTGCELTVPAAHTASPAPLTTAGTQR